MLEIIVAHLTDSHPTLQSPNPPTSQGAGSWAGSQEPGGRGRSGDRSYKVEFSTVPALGRLHAPMRLADPWAFQALPGDLSPPPMLSSVPLRSCLLDGTCLWWKGILLSTLAGRSWEQGLQSGSCSPPPPPRLHPRGDSCSLPHLCPGLP